jgi:hypothetical protein
VRTHGTYTAPTAITIAIATTSVLPDAHTLVCWIAGTAATSVTITAEQDDTEGLDDMVEMIDIMMEDWAIMEQTMAQATTVQSETVATIATQAASAVRAPALPV